jgi:hypothetical protein
MGVVETCDEQLAVATQAASASPWVGRESNMA